jgi:hypothetical protein
MRGWQIPPGVLDAFLGPAVNDHLRALPAKKQGRRLADPLGGPGDECELAFELIIHG